MKQSGFDGLPSEIEEIARVLSLHPDYQVLRRLKPDSLLSDVREGVKIVIIDTETTGTDFNKDAIIEVGALAVLVDPNTGEVGEIIGHFNGLEDPGFPIPPESTEIHGITDAMVAGQQLDEAALRALLKDAHLILAHNAQFDRTFLEKRFEFFTDLPFGCTLKQIAWRQEGFGSAALEYLVYRLGFFYYGHRAVNDCEAVLALLAQPLPVSGRMPCDVLFEKASEPEFVIHAVKAPIEVKDVLKAKGFRWSADERVWKVSVSGELQGREMIEWMKTEVYRKNKTDKLTLGFEKRTAKQKFSNAVLKVSYKEV
jgi:DNA polymerase-3 subunit epsilon